MDHNLHGRISPTKKEIKEKSKRDCGEPSLHLLPIEKIKTVDSCVEIAKFLNRTSKYSKAV